MLNIQQKYIPIGTKRRSGFKLSGVKFLTAHDVGNPNTTAIQNVGYFINSADEVEASAHVFIDDENIIECIPLDEKAWHVWYSVLTDNIKYGADANDSSIGVELCYFPSNPARTRIAYNNYVDYMAYLCKKFDLDPILRISGHFQLDPNRKTDPMNAFNVIGKKFPDFLKDVQMAMNARPIAPIAPAKIGQIGENIATIQSILMKRGYGLSTFTSGLYDENMAKSVLLFQLENKVADYRELAGLRGEVVGPKTLKALSQK